VINIKPNKGEFKMEEVTIRELKEEIFKKDF